MTAEDLKRIVATEQRARQRFQHRVHVCVAAGCLSLSSDQVKEALGVEAKRCGLDKACLVKGVGCMGPCAAGPLVSVESEGVVYHGVKVKDAPDVIQNLGKSPVTRLAYPNDTPFFQLSSRSCWRTRGKWIPNASRIISVPAAIRLCSQF
jgi:bidirectional [NiFe] hydrogenase diaphorase subunit